MPTALKPARRGMRKASSARPEIEIGKTPPLQSLALAAIMHMRRAVAVLGPGGGILLANPPFRRLLRNSGANELRLLLKQVGAVLDAECLHHLNLSDGRALKLETTPIPQGVFVAIDDVTDPAASGALVEAQIDPLTTLGNGPMFREVLVQLLEGREPEGQKIGVLCLNLDRFKEINDTLGRPIGDALLCVVADRLRSALKESDTAARTGGDEFAIVQAGGKQPQAAITLAKRLVDLIGRSYVIEGHLLNVGACVGIAIAPDDASDAERLQKCADVALTRAKREGRGTYRLFETAMDEEMHARRTLELELRRVLALRELELHYQPQFNIAASRVTGFEALLRWRHPERGMVSPAQFIPLAEETGLIVPIGEWVIRNACREAAGWREPLGIAVNVSALQVGPGLVSIVVSALAESNIDPRRLEIEITEGVLLKDAGAAIDILHRIRALGVRISMDDFGTGYSSLSYLRSFPFDKIKIDQSFVRGEAIDENSVAIVRAIAALGRSLGMTTTAEGVETAEQFARIAADGCTDIQGYLISRPMPAEAIPAFLEKQSGSPALPRLMSDRL